MMAMYEDKYASEQTTVALSKWISVHDTGVHTNCHLNTLNQHTVPGSEGGEEIFGNAIIALHGD